MVENEVKKIERDEIIVCGVCNNAIPKDFLERSVVGGKNLYCQYCGVSLNLDYDLKINNEYGESPITSSNTQKESSLTNVQQSSQESEFSLSYLNIRNSLRSYIFQLIYQLLKTTPFTFKKIQNKKELKSSHINMILKKIWKELKDLKPNDLANQNLVSSKRRIKNYFEEFQSTLRPYKKFRKRNFALFAENIEFVFGLIIGDYEFSNLTTSKKRIVIELKKCFGFKSDATTTNSFTYNISMIMSKKIHSILNQYYISEGNDNKLALDEIIGYVIDYIVKNKVKSSDLSEFNSSKKKKFYNTLEILIKNVKTDWIYRKSFEDHIYKLSIIVNSLTNDVDYSSRLTGFERLISQGLKQSALFEKDQDFSPHFKLNFTLILCRIIYLKIKNTPIITKLNSQPVNLSNKDKIVVKDSILDEITAGKKFNSQILKKFYKFSLEEFQTYYEKLHNKLTSDLIYVESFRDYIGDLVRLVFNIVHSISKKSQLTKLELAVIKDLANYNFDWFNKKPERSYFYYLNLSNQSNEDSYEESVEQISYTTLNLINDLLQLVPDIDDQFKNLSKSKLLETISTFIFDKGKHFLKHILSKIRNSNNPDYNPNYKFSIKVLDIAEKNIKEKYGSSSELVLKKIEKFRYVNRDLKEYFHEQWKKHNPDLKSRFFKHLDTVEKTYWFGFLCSDGSITSGNDPSRKRYQISIEISKKDRSHLVKFCRTVGLNPAKIGERTRVLNNKNHRLAYIIFTCKPMFQDIENLGLREFKEGNELKFNMSNNDLSYALLLGIYDGDGKEGRTTIYSTNYPALLQIKNVFKINREIRKREVDEISEDLKFKIQRTKPIYEFALTPNLLNKMMNSYNNSLTRKRKRFSEQVHVMETIKNKIRSPEVLEKLIKTHGKENLAKMLNISFNTLHKLSLEWDVSVKNISAVEKLKLKVKTKDNLINMIETNGKEKTAKELKTGPKTLHNLMEEWNINAKYLNKRELLKKKIGSKENLQKLLKHSSLTQLAKKYGVGRNTLKRLCDEWEV